MQLQPTLIPSKPPINVGEAAGPLNPQDTDFYVHPHLTPDNDAHKGRMLRSSGSIPAGTVMLVDTPYAIVPIPPAPARAGGSLATTTPLELLCSNLVCSRLVRLPNEKSMACPRNCDRDVVWCSEACRFADKVRHEYECRWLKQRGAVMRQTETNYDFITLWHVVRLLAGWYLEVRSAGATWMTNSTAANASTTMGTAGQDPPLNGTHIGDRRFSWNWEAVLLCCDYLDLWPESQIEHWRRLAKTYMSNEDEGEAVLPCPLNLGQMVSLICKEETNTFGLYPKATGTETTPIPGTKQSRGESYGLSLYPRAAMFNHSCRPNVSHKPDARGRMVFTAARDISKGEECFITYFDLAAHADVHSRQKYVLEQFRFRCTCDKCIDDEARENLEGNDALPFGDF